MMMIQKTNLALFAPYSFIFMPILINDPALTREIKAEIRSSCEEIAQDRASEISKYEAQLIFDKLTEIDKSRQSVVKTLSNYLFAIYEHLDLENNFEFKTKSEKLLLASLIYFAIVDDVIPDHIAYIGLLDDVYCVNYALSKQSNPVKDKIERLVKALALIS